MNAIQLLSAHPWVERLGWTLVHFLWQGALIAALYAVARKRIGQARSAQIRYVLGCLALTAMVAAPIVTLCLSGTRNSASGEVFTETVPLSSAATVVSPAALPVIVTHPWRDDVMPWVVMAWFAGAIIFWVRLVGGWVVAARMRSMLVRPAPEEWQRTLDAIRGRIRVSLPVRLLVSALVQVPTVVGWLRPVVLVPVGALAGLPAEHVEALLAHELAHIRRHDYLVNILQSVAEALLFYHPAVWWISNHIRNEREHCCDDGAVQVGGDSLVYARALAGLESCRPAHFNPVLAANGGSLPERIGRVLGQPGRFSGQQPGPGAGIAMGLLIATSIALFAQVPSRHPVFEAAAVKINNSGAQDSAEELLPGGRATLRNVTMRQLIMLGHNVDRPEQVFGGPGWLDADRFDVVAKATSNSSESDLRLMLQSLLQERFHLTAHAGEKEMNAYALVVAKGGARLGVSEPENHDEEGCKRAPDPGPAGERRQSCVSTMNWLSLAIPVLAKGYIDRAVIDRTGLVGAYRYDLDWVGVVQQTISGGPTIFDAVGKLGLELQSRKLSVPVVIVDSVDRTPTGE